MILSCLIWMWKWQLTFLSKCHQAIILKSLLKRFIFWKSQMLYWPQYQNSFLLFVGFCTLEIQELTEDFHDLHLQKATISFHLWWKDGWKIKSWIRKTLGRKRAAQWPHNCWSQLHYIVGLLWGLYFLLDSQQFCRVGYLPDVECKASEVKTCPAPHSPKLVPTFQRLFSSLSINLVCT